MYEILWLLPIDGTGNLFAMGSTAGIVYVFKSAVLLGKCNKM